MVWGCFFRLVLRSGFSGVLFWLTGMKSQVLGEFRGEHSKVLRNIEGQIIYPLPIRPGSSLFFVLGSLFFTEV